MSSEGESNGYQSTESKYKGGAKEMYVTYDLEQATRGEGSATYPKVKRVYIAGDVTGRDVGHFEKQSGSKVFGVKVEYERTREGYHRSGYTAERSDTGTEYEVKPTRVEESSSQFSQIVELPENAENIQFREGDLPEKYRSALQDVR
ncbi:hypothetical protein ACONUD_18110 [Microbulbifer harenosus]|uniref:Uncharacterized protein n=1 Tax=Microbulbifer harenosus TaxID=2576840 RepID=A0ABY2UJP6_9GAMM|nr:hypothetical protein [Microbulbifer harenosus]TLM78145.1 hypothetical protein FDY93_06890 [Microbulbifer harenosus]